MFKTLRDKQWRKYSHFHMIIKNLIMIIFLLIIINYIGKI